VAIVGVESMLLAAGTVAELASGVGGLEWRVLGLVLGLIGGGLVLGFI
jgi:hypothetical protein